jgi:hypothetical protein
MDCEQVRNLLSDLLDGSLPDDVRTGVNGHLQECLPCRAEREGLEDTLHALRTLPAGKAPAELLERVRRGIAREQARGAPLWKRLFLPAHIKIPLEAAAVVLITLLVIGTQKQELPELFSPKPAARMDAAPAANEGGSGKPAGPQRKKSGPAPAEKTTAATTPAAGSRSAAVGKREVSSSPTAPSPQTALPPKAALPSVPAQRVSTAGERIEPASPPAGLGRPAPAGRVMTIEVSAENRAGMEERIAAAALRWGGSAQIDDATAGEMAERTENGVRVRLPAHSAAPFLDELSRMGTLPPEGDLGLSAGMPLEPVAYTVHIRVR